jgi:TrmH family RNA methyltransferase
MMGHEMNASAHDRLRRVTSRQNALLKSMRQAFASAETTEQGWVAIEGVKTIDEAIRSGLKLHAVVFSDGGTARAEHLLPQIPKQAETVVVADEIFKSVVETRTPQGVAALVEFKAHALDAMLGSNDPLLLIAHGLQDPGNLGTITRTAEAFGAAGLILCEGTVSRYNAKAIRASAGSSFRLPTVNGKFETIAAKLRERGIRMVGTSSHEGSALPETDLRGSLAIVIGNEGAGLPKAVIAKLDALLTIPHASQVESLNAAMAASLILYEASRQRRTFL